MKSFAFLLLALVALAALPVAANATPVCLGYTVSTISGSNTCTFSDLTFTFNGETFNPTSTGDSLTIASESIVGSDVALTFQVNPGTSGFPIDVLLSYVVSSTSADISGIDASYLGTNGSISETACDGPFVQGVCSGNVLSSISIANNNGNKTVIGTPASFGPDSTVWISKDFDSPVSTSEFTDSIIETTPTPEPATGLFLGIAFCGMGLVSRKLRRSQS